MSHYTNPNVCPTLTHDDNSLVFFMIWFSAFPPFIHSFCIFFSDTCLVTDHMTKIWMVQPVSVGPIFSPASQLLANSVFCLKSNL